MSTSDEIFTALAAASDIFELVVGAPTDADVERIRCAVVKILQSFHNHGKNDILSGLIELEAKYTSCFVHAFDRLEEIYAKNYDPNMPSDPNNQDMQKQDGIFKAKKARAILIIIINAEVCQLILAVVEETWVIQIKDPNTYYNEVTARQLLNHLDKNCDGLDETDDINIYLAIPTWWEETTRVPRYILRVEKGQKKAVQTNCTI